jgi:uncharacterized delta-60 repeat protein
MVAPVVTTSGGTRAASEQVSIAVDSALVVSDTDSARLASATVSISGGYQSGEDVLGFINDNATMGNIVASYNSITGVLTLTSSGTSATLAQWQAALRAVTYTDTSDAPNTTTNRTISFQVNDGSASSATSAKTLTVAAVDDAPSFAAGSGKVSMGAGTAYGMQVQPDGKILLTGQFNGDVTVVRYNTDGTLDTTFGTGGRVTTPFGSFSEAQSVQLQPDGKIVVAGSNNSDFLVVRYNADGSLDTTFGTGGKVTTALTATDVGRSVLIQTDGKIVLAGYTESHFPLAFTVVRYNTDGSLDTTFGTGGAVTTQVGWLTDAAFSAQLQPDGKIVVVGAGANDAHRNVDFDVVRYNTDGSLDTTFGNGGKLQTPVGIDNDVAASVLVQPDGKIVVAGSAVSGIFSTDFALVRYNTDGSLDTTFGIGGKVLTPVGPALDVGVSVQLQPDGKIVLSGYSAPEDGSRNDFSVVRYNADGSLDTTFGTGGKVTTLGTGYGYSVDLQPDGKIVVAGTGFGVARYNADGSLDTRFGLADTLDGTPSFTEDGPAVVLDASTQVYDAELHAAGNYAGASLTLARHNGANAQDSYSAKTGGNLSALSESGALVLSGVIIGTVTQNSAGRLVLTFNGSATEARVNEAMQSIAYANSSDTPPSSVQIDWTFSDGNSAAAQGSGGAKSVIGSTTVSITESNDAPVALDRSVVGGEDNVINSTLTASDVDLMFLSYSLVSDAAHGSVTVNPNGGFSYTPNADFYGSDSFTFKVNDGSADSNVATITLTVLADNDAPVIAAKAGLSVSEGASGAITTALLKVTDVDNTDAQLAYTITSATTHGTLSRNGVALGMNGTFTQADINAGLIAYRHDGTETTSDSFGFSVSDGSGGSVTGQTFALTIAPVNDTPVLGGDNAITVAEGGTVAITVADLTATDPDNTDAQLTFTVTATAHGKVLLGTAEVSSFTQADIRAGNVKFEHDGTERDGGFTVSLSDGAASGGSTTVNVTVNPHLNDAPVLGGDNAIAVAEGGTVAITVADLTATDPDNTDAQLTFTVTATAHGKVLLGTTEVSSFTQADIRAGNVKFQHDGTELDGSFTVSSSDGAASGGSTTVNAIVNPHGNDAPVAADGFASGNEDAVIIGMLTATDADSPSLTYRVVAQAAHGSVRVNTDGSFSYRPNADFNGTDSFTFAASDGFADSNSATVNVTVAAVNDAPVLDVPAGVVYQSGSVILAPGLTISDVDSATLASATVRVRAGAFAAHDDVLSIGAAGLAGTNIVASYNVATETLTLVGTDTLAHYSQALENVAFQTSNFGLDRAQTIEWQLNDGSTANNLSDVASTALSMPRQQTNDFSGNGHSGILWQHTDGTVAIWSMNGTSLVSGASVAFNPGPSWHTIGSGDFNGDGKADILWQGVDGSPAIWLMDGTNILSGANVGLNPGPAWHVISAGDFDGDGKADILWQNNNGQAAVWLMDGQALKSGSDVGPNPGADWHVVSSGDFNGDGKADILWQNQNGQAAVWLMDGRNLISGANVGANPGADWHVQGAGDFNGDGKADILWQNTDGTPAIWLMNGQSLVSGSNVGFNPGPAWQIHGTGDFNGDGKADIEWQNTDGTPAVWLMDGFNLVAGSNVGFNPGANWHEIPPHHDLLV